MRKKKCIFLLLLLLNLHQLLLKTLEIHSAREDLKKIKLHTKTSSFEICAKKNTYLPSLEILTAELKTQKTLPATLIMLLLH